MDYLDWIFISGLLVAGFGFYLAHSINKTAENQKGEND